MKVNLVSITSPVSEETKGFTPEDLIVYTARVSSPQNQANVETSAKLIKYLITHRHWSPFEMVDLTVEIETSLDIAAQILRHRSANFQQLSGRYAKLLEFEYWAARRQDDKNKQNSIDDLPEQVKLQYLCDQKEVWDFCYAKYEKLLSQGVAKECARHILPVGTKTRMYMKGCVRTWIHYLQSRTDPSAQKEHRDVAEAISVLFRKEFPNVCEAAGL